MVKRASTKRLVELFCVCSALLAIAPGVHAQYQLIIVEKVYHAQHLAGIVTDSEGGTISGVVVEEFDRTFQKVLARTTTDEKGHFTFKNSKPGVYHLQFSFRGFDPMRIKVRVKPSAKNDLHVAMVVAT